MRKCLSCGRTPESKPYGGIEGQHCRPTYCYEQGINPRAEEHVRRRNRLRDEAQEWGPRPKDWRLDIFYNLRWHATLRGPAGAGFSVSPSMSGGFNAYGPFFGEGPTVREALRCAALAAYTEALRVAEAGKVYADAAASI